LTQNTFFNRQPLHLRPDSTRVVVRPFKPVAEPRDFNSTDRTRANHIVDRVLALDAATVTSQLADVLENFRGRHRNLLEIFEARADEMGVALSDHPSFTQDQRRLIGAYFLHEYSFEAAALFNPSIVTHPDQSGVPSGDRRFILSLRAVGEGHISSLTFRSGVISLDGSVSVDPPARLASIPRLCTPLAPGADRAELTFRLEEDLSERVIFPVLPSQSNGIEDARFVEFYDEGARTYYATYTAYTGRDIRSELLETRDFVTFRMFQMSGSATQNKGMALFPRRIGGHYAMIGRQDNENLYLI
jgi:beta-1,4-mannooligosaccharide phosphorylase